MYDEWDNLEDTREGLTKTLYKGQKDSFNESISNLNSRLHKLKADEKKYSIGLVPILIFVTSFFLLFLNEIIGIIGIIIFIGYAIIGIASLPKVRSEMQSVENDIAHFRRMKSKEDEKVILQTHSIEYLLTELDKLIENLRRKYSTKNEKIVVGHKTMNEGSIFQHEVKQYATRSRDLPEHRIEKMVLDSYPSDIELEIIRRGNEVLDDLIGKYRSGENLEITKRILKKLSPEQVGEKFEEYEMLEDAENWYASNKLFNDAKRLKKKMRLKIDQTVVHGDYVDDRDTIVKDSVINRSNVGGGSSKMQELEKLAEMKKEGLIDDDEFKQMKKEILGKDSP